MAWVYILKDDLSGRFYIGSTNDLQRRLKQHRNGHTQTTRWMKSFTLVFSQDYPSLADARDIERQLKRLKRRDYIERIITDNYIRMQVRQPRR